MHILIKVTIPVISSIIIFSCKASGPLTPNEAFLMARAAARSSDYAVLADLMSKESIQKIETTSYLFKNMPEERIIAIAQAYGISPDAIQNLSHENYIKIMLSDDTSILKRALNAEITGIEIQGSKAVVELHNGLFLDFIQEGPYWKLSIENL